MRSPYALTVDGVIWARSDPRAKNLILEFPRVQVGSVQEEAWCVLAAFAHEHPRVMSGAEGVGSPWRVGVIDLIEGEQGGGTWLQPVVETPVCVPVRGEEQPDQQGDAWVRSLISLSAASQTLPVGVSYFLGKSARGSGSADNHLLLGVGDLSSRAGWRYLDFQSEFGAAPAPPQEIPRYRETSSFELDPVQLSVDTLEIPALSGRIRSRFRRVKQVGLRL